MRMQAQEVETEKQFVESRENFEKLISELSSAESLEMSHSELENLLH